MILSGQQVEGFWRDGYLIARQMATPERVQLLRSLAEAHCGGQRTPLELEADLQYPGAPAAPDAPGGDTPRRLLQAFDRDPELASWARDEAVVATVQQLLGDKQIMLTRCHHNCVMTKMPEFSSVTSWHQDIRYWRFDNDKLINCWLALGAETLDNGCLLVIPGSHRLQLADDRFDEARFLVCDQAENQRLIEQAVPIELNPGDALFFHAGCFHAAGNNKTTDTKYTVIFTYHGAGTHPEPATRSSRLPEIVVYP